MRVVRRSAVILEYGANFRYLEANRAPSKEREREKEKEKEEGQNNEERAGDRKTMKRQRRSMREGKKEITGSFFS
jgi:hypothetical protein